MAYQAPVIVIPGITASYLRDEYPLDPETVWAILRKGYDRTALHPDDTPYELMEPARVVVDKVFGLPYGEFVDEIRHDLSQRADEPTPVYPFAYDWRQPLDWIEGQLADFVDEVIARTKLMRHYHSAGYAADPRVDLVGHSMGSLIIAGYVESHGGAKVGKVATMGGPFRGSFEAVLKVATGNADLGAGRSASREREVARLTPALYHLLPRYRGAVTAEEGLERDLFKPAAWQQSVVQTLAEYIRLHGVDKGLSRLRRLEKAEELFGRMLRGARAHRRRLERFDLSSSGLSPDDWLCIIGVGEKTRVRLRIHRSGSRPVFDLDSTDRVNGYVKPRTGTSRRRGCGIPAMVRCRTKAPNRRSCPSRSWCASWTTTSATGSSGTGPWSGSARASTASYRR